MHALAGRAETCSGLHHERLVEERPPVLHADDGPFLCRDGPRERAAVHLVAEDGRARAAERDAAVVARAVGVVQKLLPDLERGAVLAGLDPVRAEVDREAARAEVDARVPVRRRGAAERVARAALAAEAGLPDAATEVDVRLARRVRDLAERLQRAARVEVELLRMRRRRLAEGERVGDDERAAVVDVDLAGRGTRLVAQDDVLRRERAAVDDDAVGDVNFRRHRLVAHVVGAPAVERAAVQRQRGRRRMDERSVVAHVDLRHAEGSAVDRQLRLKSLRRRGRGHAAVEREVEGRSAVERAVVHHDLACGLHRAFRHGRTLTDRESIGERHHRRVIVVPDRADHHAALAHHQVLEGGRRPVAVCLDAV